MLLRRADVIEGALGLLDDEGLDGLTLRRLGERLGVRASALYRHVPSKEALLDAMAEAVLEGVGEDLEGVDWPERFSCLARRLRAALLAHRDGARLVAGTYIAGRNTLGAGEAAFSLLSAAGLPSKEAGWLTFAAFYYVLGHTIEEQAQARLPSDDDWHARLARSDAPISSEFASALSAVLGSDPAERFDYGIQILVDGVRNRLSSSSRSASLRPRRPATRPPSGTAPQPRR
jgi:TetR/AcrR family tetracycline transcriptional repressor